MLIPIASLNQLADAELSQLHEHFTDEEILDLTVCIAAFVALGRTLNVLGIEHTELTDVTYTPSH